MKKVLFSVFAHPDDESFGPSGTLIKEIRENNTDVHLITLTSGQNGTNPDNSADLGAVRLDEWRAAGRLMGVTTQHHLGYSDGELCNAVYLEIASKLTAVVEEALSRYNEPCEIEFMSFDLNGLTGHIDHIVAARVACFVFYTLKSTDDRFTRIRLACLPESLVPQDDLAWIYMECGRTSEEIDETVDATIYRDDIISVMRSHHSQRHDCDKMLNLCGDTLGINHFIVKS